MATTTHIKFGDGLSVTDEGAGVIRVDSVGATGPAGPPGTSFGNIDGGAPDSVYGGTNPSDGGGP